jgi:hypothetical protein
MAFESKNSRYDGRPFLRLLEVYILWAIGELEPQLAALIDELTPNLQKTYNRGGNWQSIIAAEMSFSDDFPEKLKELWTKNTEIARMNRTTLSAQTFAEMICDENFSIDKSD